MATNTISRTPSFGTFVGSRLGRLGNVSVDPRCCCIACQTLQCLERTRFFAGQLLSEADLNNEQSYWLAKARLHNRFLHGWGVVCGMQVVCSECPGWVTVKTGYAIDPCGNDIIVCTDQPFNLLKAIQDCCAAAKQPAPNCSPLRYTPSPNCKDLIQKWCITIEYKEQESRLVTPLVASPSQPSSCGCGCGPNNGDAKGTGYGNGGGNGSSYFMKSSASSCASVATQPQPATPPPASCEPTRIVEGFQLGIVCPPGSLTKPEGPQPGSLIYQLELCAQGIILLIQQMPNVTQAQDVQTAYQMTCKFLQAVNQYFAKNSSATHCTILDDLSAISVPPPQAGTDISVYVGIVAKIMTDLVNALLDCICFALLPACQPDPCDDRLILACVTVQDGTILDICHFTGRKQLITIPALQYWLGPLGLDKLESAIDKLLEFPCCRDFADRGNINVFTGREAYQQESFTSAGIASPAVVNRIAAHYLAQTLGASALNAVAPGTRAVDLRAFVGQDFRAVLDNLHGQKFTQVNTVSVAEDPSWTPEAIASAGEFVPAAVSVGQPLTMYTSGNLVVGFEVVDPTTAKLQDLQNQINQLQKHVGAPAAGPRAKK
jgi:hypothetical protein